MTRTLLPWLTGALLVLPPAFAEPRSEEPSGPLQAALVELKSSLALTPAQQVQFARAIATTQEVLPQLRANHRAMLDATKAELAREVPDLSALAVQRDDTVLADLALRQRARAEWLDLYAQLTPEQIAILRAELQRRAEQAEALRALIAPRVPASGALFI